MCTILKLLSQEFFHQSKFYLSNILFTYPGWIILLHPHETDDIILFHRLISEQNYHNFDKFTLGLHVERVTNADHVFISI